MLTPITNAAVASRTTANAAGLGAPSSVTAEQGRSELNVDGPLGRGAGVKAPLASLLRYGEEGSRAKTSATSKHTEENDFTILIPRAQHSMRVRPASVPDLREGGALAMSL